MLQKPKLPDQQKPINKPVYLKKEVSELTETSFF